MHSLSLLLSLAPLAAMALPQQNSDDPEVLTPDPTASMYALPSSMPVGGILSGYYNDAIPPQVTGAVATSLASAIYSYEKDLFTDTKYRSIANEVYMAAASASADDLFLGNNFEMPFTTASWYTNGVPEGDRKAIESYVQSYKAIETSVLGGKAAATTSGAAAPSSTGGSAGPSKTASPSSNSPSQTGKDDKAAASSSTSAGGAPAATGRVIAGLAAGVAMGLAAAL
ncbi:hypothetical protein PG990_003346 [Apiospora arundinis]|uniref:Uncharacterized protein n=1 Tax=Apiospora arundinis TaxID=335852 RepID=A0ABR2IH86_9PEZI